MVGFKSLWLLLTLLIFAACVPQSKQTSCGSNEAFSPTLRTCVPVLPGPKINIDNPIPTTTLTKYKSDTVPVSFSISIDNPFSLAYTVVWERIYNGIPIAITPTTETSYTFAPSLLATQLGTHNIVVKVLDSSNTVMDTHSFEIRINDNPRPIIDTATITPAIYASTFTPTDLAVDFEFTIKNNNASVAGAGYKTIFDLYRSGAPIDTETDLFVDETSTGTNLPSYNFDPNALGVGSYTLRARITNTALEVVAEQQWSITVQHPTLTPVIARDLFAGSSVPVYSTTVVAYNNVAHNVATGYNFIPVGQAAQADFCVQVANYEGTYALDGYFVRVDFYLDNATLIYSASTSAAVGGDEICLTDDATAIANTLFTNPTTTSTVAHTVVAKVYDERTGQEYATANLNSGLGTYPITWNISVKPQNAAPTVSFGPLTTISCPTTSGSTKNNCTVPSDTNFTVNIALASDDFYSFPGDEGNFDYSIRLYQNSVLIQTCTKSDPGYDGSTDMDGSDGYDCVFHIESYNGSGPLNTLAQTYQIQAEISDDGSPILAGDISSLPLTWNFAAAGVTETNTVPVIANWTVSAAIAEGADLILTADITDAERDNHTYTIEYCLDAGCTTWGTLTSGTITRTTNTNPYTLSLDPTLPEDFLQNFPALDCAAGPRQGDDLLRGESCNIQLRLNVTDVPYVATPLTASSGYETSVITNTNPAPVLDTTLSTPNPATWLASIAFVGFPISISNVPATVLSDTSTVVSEKTFRYQWYAKNNTSVAAWTAIDNATGPNLIWTPSIVGVTSGLNNDNPVQVMLCVDDQPATAVPTPNTTDSVCSSATPWSVTVQNNVASVLDISSITPTTELATDTSHLGTETAIWYETPSTHNGVTSSAAYIAMIGNDKRIHVKKVLVRDNGQIDTINAALVVSFDAVPTGTLESVRDLSITGTTTDLYVAYLASRNTAPFSFYPQVRRIDISGTKGGSNNHAGKFGFDYDGLSVTNGCTLATECIVTSGTTTTIQFAPTGPITGSLSLVTPVGTSTINFAASPASDEIGESWTAIDMATGLVNIINNSTDPILAGLTASSGGTDTVTISGSAPDDYFDASTHASPRTADQLGKIYVHAGNWYVPFINSQLGGAYNDKLSVYYGATAAVINPVAVTLLEASGTNGPASMDAALKFDNYYDGTNVWVAMITKTGSLGKLYKANPTTFVFASGPDDESIFTSDALLDIQVGAGSTRTFVGVRVSAGSQLKIGVYDSNVNMLSEFEIDDLTHVDAASDTEDFFNTSDISSWKIIPYNTEARIVAASKGTGTTYQLYMARLRDVSGTWTLSCGDCDQVSEFKESVSPYVKIGYAPIRIKGTLPAPLASYRLATDGSIPNQGVKDVAFITYGRIDSADVTGDSCDPFIGILNVEGEQVGATDTYIGGAPDVDVGLYRTPLVKN